MTRARWQGVATAIAAVALLSACDNRTEDKELTARIVAQLEAQKTPEQKAADLVAAAVQAQQNAVLSRMVREVQTLQSIMNNPKSFELVTVTHIEKSSVNCITYRGTNGFNALVLERIATGPGSKTLEWNAACAGKSAADWTARVRPKL